MLPATNFISDIRNATVCFARLVRAHGGALRRPQVGGDLVDHNEGGFVADQLLPDLGAGSGALLVALSHNVVARGTADLISDLPPDRERL